MSSIKKLFWSVMLFSVFVFLCGISAADTVASGDAVVAITGSGFVPQNLTMTQGATVTWSNNDVNAYYPRAHRISTDHTGVAVFLSRRLVPGETFSYVFDVPGVVAYHSESDPSMTGRIVVLPLVPSTTLSTTTTVPVASVPGKVLSNKTYNVYITDHSLVPEELVVEAGGTVVWVNVDGSPRYSVCHRIKSNYSDGCPGTYKIVSGRYPSGVEFYSDPLRIGDVFSYTFTLPGVYSYYEAQRSAMTGTVTVR